MSNKDSINVFGELSGQVAAVKRRELRAEDLCRAYLSQIEKFDAELMAFTEVNNDALAQARELDLRIERGEQAGRAAGAFIAVKDNYINPELECTVGTDSPDWNAPGGGVDSVCVERLRSEDAIILGLTRMHALAWGNVTPPTRNPWDKRFVPGGSSGGSGAAVAAGMCAAALGSDTGGSVRMPAAMCGVCGFKPTFGAVDSAGIVPHSWSLDHPGPLARSVEDLSLMYSVMAGEGDVPTAQCVEGGLSDRVVGLIGNHFSERLAPDVESVWNDALATLTGIGVRTAQFEIPELEFGLGAIFAIEIASAATVFDRFASEGRTAELPDDVRDLIDMGRMVSAVDYLHAERVRKLLFEEFSKVLTQTDVIATPTMPITAWPAGEWTVDVDGTEENVLDASWRFTYPFNLTGLPAVTIPIGRDPRGLPIGMQLVGRPGADKKLLEFAKEASFLTCGIGNPSGY